SLSLVLLPHSCCPADVFPGLVHTLNQVVETELFMLFFFSSRRRHTRCYRDWSSDVCSSDLEESQGNGQFDRVCRLLSKVVDGIRSEERRVGKECRSRWAAYYLKKKR